MKMLNDSKKHKNTKQIRKLYEHRNNYMKTYMHKVSKMVIKYVLQNHCNEIIIGDLKDIKSEMKNNKEFVSIPLQLLVQMIEYKSRLKRIRVIKISESYTSGVSAIDKE